MCRFCACFDEILMDGDNLHVHEEEDGYLIYVALPGFDKEEIDITFHNGLLTISATSNSEDHPLKRSLTQQLFLVRQVDRDKIKAELDKGILKIFLPFPEKDKPKKIEISA